MIKSFYIAFENSEEWEHSEDWGVICSRYRFPDATIKENKVNVAGSNGVIDLSSELTGDVVFNNVQGEINFIILRDSNFDYLAFKNKYHGKRVKIMPDNDTEHFRIGRLSIKEDNNQDVLKRVSMVLDADPFRYSVQERKYEIDINTNAKKQPKKAEDAYEHATVSLKNNVYSVNTNGKTSESNITINGTKYKKIYAFIVTRISFDTQPQKRYFISFKVQNKYMTKPEEAPVGAVNSTSIAIEPGSSKITIMDSESSIIEKNKFSISEVENGEVLISAFVDSLDEEIKIGLNAKIYTVKKSGAATILRAEEGVFKISDIVFIEISNDVSLQNDGRKSVVPTLVSTKDCDIIINDCFSKLYANTEKKNFDLIVENGVVNNMIAYGSEEGTVKIKYREAYL